MARTTGNASDLITFTRASTGTFLGSNGLLQTATTNTPRVEYDANGVAKGLLIEEARTNLISQSDNIVAPWTLSQASFDLSTQKLTSNSTSSYVRFTYPALTNNTNHAYSFYAKAGTLNWVWAYIRDQSSSNHSCFFNLATGAIGLASGSASWSIEDKGDGWYRIIGTFDSSSGTNRFIQIQLASANGSTAGLEPGDTLFVKHIQLEQGTFPTSYIPTSGATATRSADIASVSVSEFGYNQAQGTVVVEANPILSGSPIGLQGIVEFNNGTTNDQITIINENNDRLRIIIDPTSAANDVDFTISGAEGSEKYAAAWATNDVQAAHGGLLGAGDTSSNPPATITTLTIGNDAGSSIPLNGHIKSLNYYPLRLSDAKLQELTS